jgi:crotonobetainyl-CoA:carnitine CoA-transferase CaiB-like acyl-CoA transferase
MRAEFKLDRRVCVGSTDWLTRIALGDFENMSKLRGIRVLDLTVFLPGPMMTLQMADHGAEVWKIEPPGGDPARALSPFEAGQSVWFNNLNRGKKSVMLDLKSKAGKAQLWEMVDWADVLVEGFRPGTMERLGFGYSAVSSRNPGIVYCSITAFGQDGPLANHPAHDMAVQALSGFLSVNDGAGGTPVVPGAPAADIAAGLTALSSVLMALFSRHSTGQGAYIDCAMFDCLLPWCAHSAGEAIAGGMPPRSSSQRSLGGSAFYQIYETADKRYIVLAGREAKFITNLMTALGRIDLIRISEQPAGKQEALIAFLRETFLTKTRDEWVVWFMDKDVAFAPVLDFREALSSAHVAKRGLLVEHEGAHQLAPAVRFAGERWAMATAPQLSADLWEG